MEPAKSTTCTLVRKTVLKSSGVSETKTSNLVANSYVLRLSEFTIILIVRPSVTLFS